MDRVRAMVTARYPEQEPQLEGSAADKVVFGERSETTQPYYLVSSGLGDVLKLNGGRLQDLSPGSRLDVYAPGTRNFNARAKPLAKIEVTQADTFTSKARIMSGGPVPEGSRAVERERNFGSFRFRVFMHPELPPDTVNSLRRTLSKHPHIEFVSSDSDCDLQLAKEGSNLVTLAGDGSRLSPPVRSAEPALAGTLGRQITNWAKWYQLASIDNPATAGAVSVELKAANPRPDGRILHGDEVTLTVRNLSDSAAFVNVLDLSGDGSVDPLEITNSGASEMIGSGREISRTLRMDVPPGLTSTRDLIKVFLTSTAVDLTSVVSDAIRDGSADLSQHPLGPLLARPATRNANRAIRLEGWSTAQTILITHRN
jgi:hypothetical protein